MTPLKSEQNGQEFNAFPSQRHPRGATFYTIRSSSKRRRAKLEGRQAEELDRHPAVHAVDNYAALMDEELGRLKDSNEKINLRNQLQLERRIDERAWAALMKSRYSAALQNVWLFPAPAGDAPEGARNIHSKGHKFLKRLFSCGNIAAMLGLSKSTAWEWMSSSLSADAGS